METQKWQEKYWKTQEDMIRHTKRKSRGDGHRLERQDDCCQRSCQLETNRRL